MHHLFWKIQRAWLEEGLACLNRQTLGKRNSHIDVKLLGDLYSPFVWTVQWALKLKGIEYEYVEEDLSNKSPQLLQYNPVYKKVPVLVHAGKPIVESVVIVEYIEETWKENPLLPENAYDRAIARFWAGFLENKLGYPIWTFFCSARKDQEKAFQEILESLKTLEEHGIKGKKFFAGDTIGFTDIIMGKMSYWLPVMEEILGIKLVDPHSFPNLHAWKENFLAHPIIKENLPPRDGLFARLKASRERCIASTTLND